MSSALQSKHGTPRSKLTGIEDSNKTKEKQIPTNFSLQLTTPSVGITGPLESINNALDGGDPLYKLQKAILNPSYELAQAYKNDAVSWQQPKQNQDGSVTLTSNPITGVNGLVSINASLSSTVLSQDTSSGYVTAGVAEVVFPNSFDRIGNKIVFFIEKQGPAIAGVISLAVILDVLSPVLRQIGSFLKSYVQNVYNRLSNDPDADPEDAAEDAASDAEDEAALEGEVVGEELTMDLSFSLMDGVGVVAALGAFAVSVVFFFLAKKMTAYVIVYNASTQQSLETNLAYTYDAQVSLQPKSGVLGPFALPTLPAGLKHLPNAEPVLKYGIYSMYNSDSIEGLGYGITSQMLENPQGGLACFVADIPADGDNSMNWVPNIQPNEVGNFYNASEGEHTVLSMGVISTNQLDGESNDPMSGDNGYYYSYLINAALISF